MSASYSFESRWRVPVRPERAWAELVRTLAPGIGPAWWPGFTLPMAPRRLVPGERMIMAVRSPDGNLLVTPRADTVMNAGDLLIVVGPVDALNDLAGRAG